MNPSEHQQTQHGDAIVHALQSIAQGVNPASKLVQMVYALYSGVATGTTVIPGDDTIPQNTEGTEFMSLAITPKDVNNLLVIEIVALVNIATAANNANGALFQDSTANALAASQHRTPGADQPAILTIKHVMAAGTIASTTFKFRAGPQGASTMTFNGSAGGRFFGAITKSSMQIWEYAP